METKAAGGGLIAPPYLWKQNFLCFCFSMFAFRKSPSVSLTPKLMRQLLIAKQMQQIYKTETKPETKVEKKPDPKSV